MNFQWLIEIYNNLLADTTFEIIETNHAKIQQTHDWKNIFITKSDETQLI